MLRRALTMGSMLLLLMLLALPAQADHANDDYFYAIDGPLFDDEDAARWADSGQETFCLGQDWNNALPDAKWNNAKLSVGHSFDHWRNNTQISKDITYGSNVECSSNWSFNTAWQNAIDGKSGLEPVWHDFCQHEDGRQSSVEYENLDLHFGSGLAGLTVTCNFNNDEYLDYFVVIIDSTRSWNFCHTCSVGDNDYDMPGVMVHEAGHAYGWEHHMTHLSGACQTGSGRNTMCAGTEGWGYYDGLFETAWRTIEQHDWEEVNANYP